MNDEELLNLMVTGIFQHDCKTDVNNYINSKMK